MHKEYLLLASIFLGVILVLSTYTLFIHKPLRPLDEENNIAGNIDESDNQQLSNIGVDEGLSTDNKSFIREVPLHLDEKTEGNLKRFRSQAKQLHKEYPQSFFISMPTDEKKVALTFDDGPDNSSTKKILEILNRNGVPATFFYIGNQVNSYKETMQATIGGNHMVANHSWSHLRPTSLEMGDFQNELLSCEGALAPYIEGGKIYRPPYGLVTEDQVAMLESEGYKVIVWSVDSMDWYFDDSNKIVECVTKTVHPGAIILMHSAGGSKNRQATVQALPDIIDKLRQAGYEFVTLQDLLKNN